MAMELNLNVEMESLVLANAASPEAKERLQQKLMEVFSDVDRRGIVDTQITYIKEALKAGKKRFTSEVERLEREMNSTWESFRKEVVRMVDEAIAEATADLVAPAAEAMSNMLFDKDISVEYDSNGFASTFAEGLVRASEEKRVVKDHRLALSRTTVLRIGRKIFNAEGRVVPDMLAEIPVCGLSRTVDFSALVTSTAARLAELARDCQEKREAYQECVRRLSEIPEKRDMLNARLVEAALRGDQVDLAAITRSVMEA
jgi:hypothetical protein